MNFVALSSKIINNLDRRRYSAPQVSKLSNKTKQKRVVYFDAFDLDATLWEKSCSFCLARAFFTLFNAAIFR